jgi:hypothetical protein
MSIEKSQILSKQKTLVDENKTLTKLITDSTFVINRRLDHFGLVFNLETINDCVEALTYLNSKASASTEALKELELEDDNSETTYLGYSISDWKKDIILRKSQIVASFKIEANNKAISLLEKHLSADDVFVRDMEKLENLLSSNPIKLNKRIVDLETDYDDKE